MRYSGDDPLNHLPTRDGYVQLIEDFSVSNHFVCTMIDAMEAEHYPGVTAEMKPQVESAIAQTLTYIDRFFNEQLRILFNDSRWQSLANNQSEFDKSLKRALAWIRSFIRDA